MTKILRQTFTSKTRHQQYLQAIKMDIYTDYMKDMNGENNEQPGKSVFVLANNIEWS